MQISFTKVFVPEKTNCLKIYEREQKNNWIPHFLKMQLLREFPQFSFTKFLLKIHQWVLLTLFLRKYNTIAVRIVLRTFLL